MLPAIYISVGIWFDKEEGRLSRPELNICNSAKCRVKNMGGGGDSRAAEIPMPTPMIYIWDYNVLARVDSYSPICVERFILSISGRHPCIEEYVVTTNDVPYYKYSGVGTNNFILYWEGGGQLPGFVDPKKGNQLLVHI